MIEAHVNDVIGNLFWPMATHLFPVGSQGWLPLALPHGMAGKMAGHA